MAKKPRRKSRKPRAKAIRLNPLFWVRNAKDITQYRDAELFEQGGKCAISGLPLTDSSKATLDHAHSASGGGVDGKVRGVLETQINMMEGRYLKLFQKAKLDVKYGLTFPTFLINMGEYLLQDNSDKPYHVGYMNDLRKYISRLRKDQIESKLLIDFKIPITGKEDKGELVRLYTQAFVDLVEEKEKKRLTQ